ncbi:MAG TPA: DUF1801 domain-containing protein [Kofleriaceae bacterium]|nr:DUF1801 domain-containing protein [Kofleriaceae bacterium]
MAATTVASYLAALPADRKAAIARVRETINANLPDGYEEGIQYGMISWYVPLSRYPDTYNGQPLALASLASQKSHMALYLISVYGDPELARWFRQAFADAGKKLDMGKSCVRFKTLDALALDVIGETIAKVSVDDFIARQEAIRGTTKTAARTRTFAAKPARSKQPAAARRRARR